MMIEVQTGRIFNRAHIMQCRVLPKDDEWPFGLPATVSAIEITLSNGDKEFITLDQDKNPYDFVRDIMFGTTRRLDES